VHRGVRTDVTRWSVRLLRFTVVCLATSATLIAPGVAGLAPSLPLAGALFALGAACAAVRDDLSSLPTAVGYDLGRYGQDLWLAGVLGGLVVLLGPGESAVELLTLGGLVGLVGMANYFLRPIFVTILDGVRWLTTLT
jgi:hypothetical protein